MKIQSTILAIFFLLLFSTIHIDAQQIDAKKNNSNAVDDQILREKLKKEGLSDGAIDSWIEKRKSLASTEKQAIPQTIQQSQPLVVYPNSCSDMGAENGWSSWSGRAGTIDPSTGAVTWGAWSSPPPASNNNTAFTLTTGGGMDACTPAPGNPALPVVAPGFGNQSIRLGVQIEPRGFAEQISFPLTVTPADTNFVYACAIVLDNPADGNHLGNLAPHAEIYILDGTDTVPCSHHHYFGSNDNTLPPGFYQTNCNNLYSNAYKSWTTLGINLNKYVGKTLTVVVSNYDCALTGHFCHSYWDFMCVPKTVSTASVCQGQPSTICAPYDSINPYTYTWYQNGSLYTGTPSAISQCITPTTMPGDTFSVNILDSSGCDFWVPYVPMSITANFTSTTISGAINFTDLSTTSNGSPIVAWYWNFPGGTPSASTVQHPSGIAYTPGTYTVCLIVTNQSGCKDTSCQAITITINGIEDFLSSSISISPNPASGNVFIDFGSKNFGNAKASFSDMIGNTLLETTISASGKQTLDVSAFSKGIYFLKLKTDYGIATKKIVIAP